MCPNCYMSLLPRTELSECNARSFCRTMWHTVRSPPLIITKGLLRCKATRKKSWFGQISQISRLNNFMLLALEVWRPFLRRLLFSRQVPNKAFPPQSLLQHSTHCRCTSGALRNKWSEVHSVTVFLCNGASASFWFVSVLFAPFSGKKLSFPPTLVLPDSGKIMENDDLRWRTSHRLLKVLSFSCVRVRPLHSQFSPGLGDLSAHNKHGFCKRNLTA